MGRVVFIGAGPGAADLITVRGLNRLREAEVVLFDALTDPALREAAPTARWVDVGKRGFSAESTGQARINALLVEAAQSAEARRAPQGRRPERVRAGSKKSCRRWPRRALNRKSCPASPQQWLLPP